MLGFGTPPLENSFVLGAEVQVVLESRARQQLLAVDVLSSEVREGSRAAESNSLLRHFLATPNLSAHPTKAQRLIARTTSLWCYTQSKRPST